MSEREQLYFLAITGDAAVRKLIRGLPALRAELSEEFFGPEGPQTEAHQEEEKARWGDFCDQDGHWTHSAGTPYAFEECGEDYAVSIYPVDEPASLNAGATSPAEGAPESAPPSVSSSKGRV